MSYTEIFGFNKKGNAYGEADVQNAWRGGMAIWNILEERYLPTYRPSFVPEYIPDNEVEKFCHYKPSRCSAMMDPDAMKQVWALVNDNRLKECEKIALASTFDHVIILKENFPRLITAFREFEGETSLKEQSDIIEKMLNDENCIAVGFNQTSVNGDTWTNLGGYDEDGGEYIPYNILSGEKHWELFRELDSEE